jgi:hypothetical protein
MDRVGIDQEVISLSTPNLFFTDAETATCDRAHGQRRRTVS